MVSLLRALPLFDGRPVHDGTVIPDTEALVSGLDRAVFQVPVPGGSGAVIGARDEVVGRYEAIGKFGHTSGSHAGGSW